MNTRRKEILNVAARLFRKQGYQASSLKDIASAVGMEAPSLYNHIESKNEILQLLLFDIAEQFVSSIQEINKSSLTGIEKIEKVIGHYVRLSIDRPDAISLITGEWVHLIDKDRLSYLELRDQYEHYFRLIFRQAVKEGDIKPVNEDIAIFSILSTLRWLYSWINKNKTFNAIELEKQLMVVLIEGLRN